MKVAALAILTLLMCLAASAQHSVVTEAEFKTACGMTVPVSAMKRAEKYRITIETRSSVAGRPSTDYIGRIVTNYDGRTKWQAVRETTFGTTTRVSEELHLDGKTYEKDGNGNWIPKVPRTFDRFGDPNQTETRYQKIENRLLPDESYRGKMVRVCEKYELVSAKQAGDTVEMQRESTTRYWMSSEGLLKSETSFRNVGEKQTSTTWVRTEWEIDPTIRVTVPDGLQIP